MVLRWATTADEHRRRKAIAAAGLHSGFRIQHEGPMTGPGADPVGGRDWMGSQDQQG